MGEGWILTFIFCSNDLIREKLPDSKNSGFSTKFNTSLQILKSNDKSIETGKV